MNPTPTDAKEESLFHQTIAQLAYYLYVLRGCKEGRDMHWIFTSKTISPAWL
jgi:hypothetical protein